MIQSNTVGRDTYGGSTDTWATYFTTRASVNSSSAAERLGGDRVTADSTFEFIVRADPVRSITPQHRINFDSRTFDIEAVQDFEEKGHFLRVSATERQL